MEAVEQYQYRVCCTGTCTGHRYCIVPTSVPVLKTDACAASPINSVMRSVGSASARVRDIRVKMFIQPITNHQSPITNHRILSLLRSAHEVPVPGSYHQQSGSCTGTFLTHVMMPEGEGANDLTHVKMTECEGVVGKHGDSSVTAVLRRTRKGGPRARSWNVVLTPSLVNQQLQLQGVA